jgi:uncharacterized protein YcaQ
MSRVTRALLSPFDALIWNRDRTHRMFDFYYRIGVYAPAVRREDGYYLLPFLLGDRLVAIVDLKSDRRSSTLLVPNATAETGVEEAEIADALAPELDLIGRIPLPCLSRGRVRPSGDRELPCLPEAGQGAGARSAPTRGRSLA